MSNEKECSIENAHIPLRYVGVLVAVRGICKNQCFSAL